MSVVLPFDVQAWAERTADAYNAVKHANRSLADPIDMVNCWRESVLIFRIWIAQDLGVTLTDLAKRLQSEPQSSPYRSM